MGDLAATVTTSPALREGPPDPAWGTFGPDPDPVWLVVVPGSQQDRMMRLQREFTFTDRHGVVWRAPDRMVTDGASIPRALWTLIGSPFTGAYRRAAIVHDYQCKLHPHDGPERQAADEMFYEACRAGGCSPAFAYVLYLGVRIGSLVGVSPRWPRVEQAGARVHPLAAERDMQQDYMDMAQALVGPEGEAALADDAGTAVASVKAVMESRGFAARL